jgi:hypothetical protein
MRLFLERSLSSPEIRMDGVLGDDIHLIIGDMALHTGHFSVVIGLEYVIAFIRHG